MPTYAADPRFWHEYRHLPTQDQELFKAGRDEFVRCLRSWEERGCHGAPQFPARLGVKPFVFRKHQYMELSWADDGRCLWEFGAPQRPGVCHVIWRRIGSHRIYDNP
jgi:hypothetical protein